MNSKAKRSAIAPCVARTIKGLVARIERGKNIEVPGRELPDERRELAVMLITIVSSAGERKERVTQAHRVLTKLKQGAEATGLRDWS